MPADRVVARRCKSVFEARALNAVPRADAATQTDASPEPVRVRVRVRLDVSAPALAPSDAPTMGDNGGNSATRRRTTSSIAQGVLEACQRLDGGARIAYVGVDDHERTTVRLSASAASSVTALQRALRSAFPLARVATSENTLDGTMQAQIVVPNERDEWSLALGATRERRSMQLLQLAAGVLALSGFVVWSLSEPTAQI